MPFSLSKRVTQRYSPPTPPAISASTLRAIQSCNNPSACPTTQGPLPNNTFVTPVASYSLPPSEVDPEKDHIVRSKSRISSDDAYHRGGAGESEVATAAQTGQDVMDFPTTASAPAERDGEEVVDDRSTQTRLEYQPDIAGHIGGVTALTYSHDSKLLATGSEDASIIIWDVGNKAGIRTGNAHDDMVLALAFSPDDKQLGSASADSHIKIWSIETGECLATLRGHEEGIHAMAWSADGKWIASGSMDTSVRLWDAETFEQHTVLKGHETMVRFVRFSHDGRWLASGGGDSCVRLWDVEAGTLHAVLRGHKYIMVWQADFDAKGQRIVTCSDDGSAHVWSVETGENLLAINEHKDPVWDVAFNKDGTRVLTASADSTMVLCDALTGERMLSFEGHESNCYTACFSPDGKYVVSASSDTTVRLWRTAEPTRPTDKVIDQPSEESTEPTDQGNDEPADDPNGGPGGEPDAQPIPAQPTTAQDAGSALCATFREHDDRVTLVQFSPDGETLASGADDGTVHIRTRAEWDPDA